jgi:hypothetical protein
LSVNFMALLQFPMRFLRNKRRAKISCAVVRGDLRSETLETHLINHNLRSQFLLLPPTSARKQAYIYPSYGTIHVQIVLRSQKEKEPRNMTMSADELLDKAECRLASAGTCCFETGRPICM